MLLSNTGTMGRLLDHAAIGSYTLFLLADVEAEFFRIVQTKTYLKRRLSLNQAKQFITRLRTVAENVPSMELSIESFTRDKKDDYLIAYALIVDADILVSGAKDLLVMRHVLKRPLILTPAEFLGIIETGTE